MCLYFLGGKLALCEPALVLKEIEDFLYKIVNKNLHF